MYENHKKANEKYNIYNARLNMDIYDNRDSAFFDPFNQHCRELYDPKFIEESFTGFIFH